MGIKPKGLLSLLFSRVPHQRQKQDRLIPCQNSWQRHYHKSETVEFPLYLRIIPITYTFMLFSSPIKGGAGSIPGRKRIFSPYMRRCLSIYWFVAIILAKLLSWKFCKHYSKTVKNNVHKYLSNFFSSSHVTVFYDSIKKDI